MLRHVLSDADCHAARPAVDMRALPASNANVRFRSAMGIGRMQGLLQIRMNFSGH
jgi:hypothetical protein